MVMADLSRALTIHCRMDWMAVSSYGSGSQSSGVVRILKDLSTDVTGIDVLLVEDIIDTGLTLSYLVSNLRSRGPASLNVLTVFRKPEAARNPVEITYVGFDIPNEFVVGYGLDYDGLYRNLTRWVPSHPTFTADLAAYPAACGWNPHPRACRASRSETYVYGLRPCTGCNLIRDTESV